ncbi:MULTISPECIES: hypothetical protein [Actinomadura]|uniref:Uncharacterized protein n=1 Tax=Actinomadura yumaensis TaxID=111807 RepID=A0ABW2CT57_9ACTN|nr:hypothetical protein [Actinomadura sp. J1-007]
MPKSTSPAALEIAVRTHDAPVSLRVAGPTTARKSAGPPNGARRVPPQPDTRRMSRTARVRQGLAESALRANGITWRSTGGCSERTRLGCTSFDQIRWGSIDGLIGFRKATGCGLVVSGGTERGHAPGPYSHWNGYKIDIMPTACTDRYIQRYRFLGTRGDGAELYRSPANAVFARESDHWDITFH